MNSNSLQSSNNSSWQDHEKFFREMLEDVEEPTAPFGLTNIQGDGSDISEARTFIDSDLAKRVRLRARLLGVSAASIWHVACALVLGRASGQRNPVFGTVLLGRMQGNSISDQVLGLFMNTLPIRIRLEDTAARDSVLQTHQLLAELLSHEHAPLALAQRCSGVPAPMPLFTALFNYRHSVMPSGKVEKQSLAFAGITTLAGGERTNYPLTLSVDDLGEEFVLTAQTSAPLDPHYLCSMAGRALEQLVEALELKPTYPVARLDVLPASERHKLLVEWNRTEAEYPQDRCIHELFEEQAERNPEAVAVVYEDRSLSYGELNRQANRLARYLRGQGVKPDSRVAICVERSLEMVVGLLAILKAGGAYVPLDPEYPPERLAYMLTDCEPIVVLTHEPARAQLHAVLDQTGIRLPIVDLEEHGAAWVKQAETDLPPVDIGLTSRHLAYVIYTSGSTGKPKGVMVEHRGIVNRLVWMIATYEVRSKDAILQKTPFVFDVSVWEFFCPLFVGAKLVMANPGSHKDPSYLSEIIQRAHITIIHFVPSMLQDFIREGAVRDCGTLSAVFCSGEELTNHLERQFREKFSNTQLHNLYGPTEASVDVTAWDCSSSIETSSRSLPIGRPISNTRIYLLDGFGNPVPLGVVGEIYIGGVGVARGYLNRPELTAERFIDSPFVGGDRLYKTGDLGRYLADGNIEFLGRNDFQVKIRGFRIELGEIEARLISHPLVREATVIAREDEAGDKRLVAYYTVKSEPGEVGAEALRARLSGVLPEYMVPAAYVRLEVFPLTPNGKLDRKALPAPEGDAYSRREYAAPVGEVETELAKIWSEVLGIERISRHDNFFELGGHSLLAVRVLERMRRAGYETDIRKLFANPTIASIGNAAGGALRERGDHETHAPVERLGRDSPLLPSFAQQRLWFLSQMKGVSEAYHIPFGVRLSGPVDKAALHMALDQLVARHESLRTTFGATDGEPFQRIDQAHIGFALSELDLADTENTEERLEGEIAEETSTPFDLERGPLIRGRWIRLSDREHVLLITMHHIVSDGWSMGILVRELGSLYKTYILAGTDILKPLDIRYADYAAWQRQWSSGNALAEQKSYWQRTLEGVPALIALPTDRARPAQQDFSGGHVEIHLDRTTTAALKALSHRHGLTLFMTVLAAWALVLSRLSNQDDVVIGVPSANRPRLELEGLVGFFVNMLALRITLSDSPTVLALLERVRDVVLGAQLHQDLPFERVVDLIKPIRSLNHTPVFQVNLTWQNSESLQLELLGLEATSIKSRAMPAKFDLTLIIGEAADGCISGLLNYSAALFDSETVERYAGYLCKVLKSFPEAIDRPVSLITLLSPAERHKLLAEWNATETVCPHTYVHQWFEDQAFNAPEATALVYENQTLSYAELNQRANQLAHYLRSIGVCPDSRVAICVERSLEMVIGLLGIMKAGGAYVPLDPGYPSDRLAFMLRDCQPTIVLTHTPARGALQVALDRSSVTVLSVDLQRDSFLWVRRPTENLNPYRLGIAERNLAYIIYTSGSTGAPKGVMIEHRSLTNYMWYVRNQYFENQGCGSIAMHSLAFDGLLTALYGPLLSGQKLTLTRVGNEGEILKGSMERGEKFALLKMTPSHLRMIAPVLECNYPSEVADVWMLGGEEVTVRDIALLRRQFRAGRIVNHFGPTETTVGVTTYEVMQDDEARLVPIGRPIANTRIYLLDRTSEPVPRGVVGEIFIGGSGVARGYLNRPDLTAERFIASPFVKGDRLYKTGDLGRYRPDGNIEFLGRNDFQIKIRGYRVELEEIEGQLSTCAGVRQAAVVAREDNAGDKRLVAYYMTTEGEELEVETLRAYLSEKLPEYMVPAAYVWLSKFPLTFNGKLDRGALPPPEENAYGHRDYEEPIGGAETEVARIWREILGITRLGRHDSFFDLGGHSLLAVRVLERMRRAGYRFEMRQLFAAPTIASIGRHIERDLQERGLAHLTPIERTKRSRLLLPSFAQERLWFLAQIEGASRAYQISLRFRLKGTLDAGALCAALGRLVLRHEALRTTFFTDDGKIFQRISPGDVEFSLVKEDLRGSREVEAQLSKWIEYEAATPFDLENGPLIRGRLFCVEDNEHVLLITVHHIVSDGWSLGIFSRELGALYRAFSRSESDPLEPLAIQYADYAAWQRQWLSGEVLAEQSAYWQQALSGAPAAIELPMDRRRPAEQDFTGGYVPLELDQELTVGLQTLARRHRLTLFMTILAGWSLVLSRLSAQEDVVIGVPSANRNRLETEGLIGCFVNTLALRVDLSGAPTVGQFLARVKATVISAQTHEDLPFEQVVDLVKPVRSFNHTPVFQVMFAWQNAVGGALDLGGLEVSWVEGGQLPAICDLTLTLREVGGRIAGGLSYATALFDRETVERYSGYLVKVLAEMIVDDQRAVRAIPLLSASERHKLLVEWNRTEAEYPQDRCIHELFEEQAERNPEAVAVVYEDRSLSYGELNRQANRLARYLRGQGVKPDSRVAICVERSLEMVVGLLAILKAGGAYVPLDPEYPPERLAYMLTDCEPIVVLTHEPARAQLHAVLDQTGIRLPIVDLEEHGAAWVKQAETDLPPVDIGLTSRHLAYVIYTSGSTGKPKGVMVEHRGVVNLAIASAAEFEIGCESGLLPFGLSFSFDIFVLMIFAPLAIGGAIYLIGEGVIESEESLIKSLVPEITHLFVMQTLLVGIENTGAFKDILCLSIGGEVSTWQLVRRWSIGRKLVVGYGPTETTVAASLYKCGPGQEVCHSSSPPIGRPISNTRIYLLDGFGNPVPLGVVGEIYIGGVGVARGYLNRPELTAERFIDSPFVGGDRLYKTGDLGRYLADGNIEFLGRNDFQVKIRGFRIELGEIEARLISHPLVREATVIAREDEAGDKRLVAYYTVKSEPGEVGAEALRAHLSGVLPEYMVPAAYVRLEVFPLTPNGKLDRKALPAPEGDAYSRREYAAPVGEVETELAKIWSEVLGIERISRHDNFFELGGHSLLAVRVLERMRRAGLRADVRKLFERPVLSELAGVLGEGIDLVEVKPNLIPDDCKAITPDLLPLIELTQEQIDLIVGRIPGGVSNIQDIYPLAPLQEGFLFHHLMEQEGDPYLSWRQFGFSDRGTLDRYIAALDGVIARHDILRTAIVWEGLEQPVQVVLRRASIPVEEVELDPKDGDIAEQLKERFNPRRFRLDIRQAPIMRLLVAHDSEKDRWVMMRLLHHIYGDHGALEAMQAEIVAHLLGGAEELPVPLPFRNFVAQARQDVSGQDHEKFFREMLEDVEEPTAPFGLTNIQGDGSDISEARTFIDSDLAKRVRLRARLLGVSAASIWHVACALVLGRASGQRNPVFGTVLLGRMQGNSISDQVLGLFMNTLPIRIRLEDTAARDSVLQTHQLLAELLSHEHAPLALAQRCSGVPAPMPLFTALFNYRHSVMPSGKVEKQSLAFAGITTLAGEERTNYPLALSVDDLGEEFGLTAQTSAPLDPHYLCSMAGRALEQLVEALELKPTYPVARLDVLPASERHKLLVEWNRTEAEYPQDRCIHELFEEQAERNPEAVAVVYEDRSLSYGELNRQANRLARYLRGQGVKPDSRVAICVERSLEMVVGLLAILKAGGAYVPLDPEYPPERLAYMLTDCEPIVVLTHEPARAQLHAVLDQTGISLPIVDLEEHGAAWVKQAETDLPPVDIGLTSRHLAYVIYTSGSTGKPKGVMVEHRNVINYLCWATKYYDIASGNGAPINTSYAFDATVTSLWGSLASGRHLKLFTKSAAELSTLVEALHGIKEYSLIKMTPSYLSILKDCYEAGVGSEKSVRCFVIGGENLTVERLAFWRDKFPAVRLVNEYGPTETTVGVAIYEVSSALGDYVNVPIGRPISNTRIYLLDGFGNPVPLGVVGEIYIGGVGVARGYLNRPELTAERFIDSPFVGGDRLYKTGDLGRYLADGNIEFLGRNDFQVKIRGFRIELGEIEARLISHPLVREATVIAREDEAGDKRLVAYYTVKSEPGEVGAEALRAHLSGVLPEYMVPAAYVRLEVFPLTPNGKLDRKALPAPEGDAYSRREYAAPVGEVETELAKIWSEVLGIERISRHDNFFELGGHSLLAVRVLERMRRAGLRADVRKLFERPVLSELAGVLGEGIDLVEVKPNLIPDDCKAITPDLLPLIELTQEQIDLIVGRIPGGVSNIQDIYPLAPLQEGFLFHHLMEQEGDPYLLWRQFGFSDRGTLDRYIAALDGVIARHDILRTAIVWEGLEQPVQVVLRRASIPVEEVELDPKDGDIAEQLKERFNPRRFRLDIRQAPIMRLLVAHDSEKDRWVMMRLLHHIYGDHGALEAMQAEIVAHLLGGAEELPVPLPFRNFVAQARQDVSGQDHEKFFREMLEDVEEPTAPFGLTNIQGDGSDISEARTFIDSDLAKRVRLRARLLGVSAASIWHVACALVLGRASGQRNPVFGTVLLGRMQGNSISDQVLGLFMNTLPIRIRLEDTAARDSVLQTHQLLAELLSHEHAPLALAQRCSGVPAPMPLFTALFNYRHSVMPSGKVEKQSLAFAGITTLAGGERTNYPLTLSVDDLGEEFVLTAQTSAPLDPHYLCSMAGRALEQLVEALELKPTYPVARLDVLPASERHKLLVEWNRTEAEYPQDRCIHELFEEQAERNPEAVAVVYEDRSLSYGELNRQANRLARYLRGQGVKPDSRVAICVERSLEMVVGLLAILKAGGAYVPLDPEYPPERLAYMLTDCEPIVVLTHEPARAQLHAVLDQTGIRLPIVDLEEHGAAWVKQAETDLPPVDIGLTSRHLAYVIYTSGSTGKPKGVMVEHRGIVNRLVWMIATYEVRSKDAILQKTPFVFDVSVWEFFCPLFVGAKLVMANPGSHKDPSYLSEIIQRAHITIIHFVPSMLQDFIREGAVRDCGTLSAVFCSGEELTNHLERQFREKFSNTQLHNLYGPTEASVDVTAWDCSSSIETSSRSLPIGRPISNTRIYLLDGFGNPVPLGVVGEIYIGGVGVARGYLNRPELTAERFIDSPFVGGDRLYKTGDLGRYLADGNIEFLGRNDFQVKIRGFRIELGEIEARLISHPLVREATVIAREDEAGDKRLVAYYTVKSEPGEVGAEALRAHLSGVLPEYMVPAAYVRLEVFPLTPNGKLDRKALPAPEGDAYSRREYAAPVGEVETELAKIWSEVLGIERISRHDNFFELGGHSLLAVRVLERMRRAGLRADVRKLFERPVLSELAGVLGEGIDLVEVKPNLIPDDCKAITPDLLPLIELTQEQIDLIVGRIPGGVSNIQDIYSLTPLQEGFLFHHLMEQEGDPYLLWSQLGFSDRGTLDRYIAALDGVIARHDILRTAIVWEGLEQPVQVVLRRASIPVEEVELDPKDGDIAEQLKERFNPRRFRLDIRQAPIMRLLVAHDSEKDRWVMMRLLHHIYGDHGALEAMQAEIVAHLLGGAEELPVPLPFRNFVAQARQDVSGQDHEKFFREMLEDVEEPTAPFGLTNIQGDGSDISEARTFIDSDLAKRVRLRARLLGVSAASIWHVACALVLGRASGQRNPVFGTVLLGRMQGNSISDQVLGLFMNTLPIRIRLEDTAARDSVLQTHQLLAELLSHEHAPLALAQRCSGVPAPMPLFTALFNYRHSVMPSGKVEKQSLAFAGITTLAGEERTNYPLALSVDDLGEEFGLTAQTSAPLDPHYLCSMAGRALEQLVEALELKPTYPVARLDVLPASERHKLLVEWNRTEAEYPQDRCIHELFEEQAERNPEAVAVVYEDRSLSYGELNRQANRLARYLRGQGVKPDSRVAICVERSLEMVVGLLAILKAGGAYVPLDPEYPPERLAYMLTDCEPIVVLTHEPARAQLHAVLDQTGIRLPIVDLEEHGAAWVKQAETDLPPVDIGLTSRHLAYVIYTSGSTGKPKGVMVEHRGIVNRLVNSKVIAPVSKESIFSQKTTIGFVDSFVEILAPLVLTKPLVILAKEIARNPMELISALESNNVTHAVTVPSLADAIISAPTAIQRLVKLRNWTVSGEPFRAELLERLRSQLPLCRFVNLYGMTETAADSTLYVPADETSSRSLPIGRPISNTRIYLLDGFGNPVPLGVVGEIYIGGVGVARGYLNRPELTAERFIDSPFVGGDRLYKTGDLGRYLADGNIEFLGRNDFQVKIRGFRIELGEIEARLISHPLVREATVIAREDEAGDKRLVAYYTVKSEPGEVGAEALRAHLSGVLPEYMVPAAYVRLEVFPLTPNGKLDRKALPAPEGDAYSRREYAAPVGEVETELAKIWSEVLGIERISRHDNFFELGGHSLLAVRVLERMRRAGLRADVRKLFERPVLSELAGVLGEGIDLVEVKPNLIPDDCKAITPDLLPLIELTQEQIDLIVGRIPGGVSNIQDIYSLTPLQEGFLFHHLMEQEGDPYLLWRQFGFSDRGTLDRYIAALDGVIARHDILRTAIVWEGLEQPVQVVLRRASIPVEEVELDPKDGDIAEQLKERFNPRRFRLDIRQAPIMRLLVAHDSEKDRWVVMQLLHHIYGDHGTVGAMQAEIVAHLLGGAEELPVPLPFRNFVAQARQDVSGQDHEKFFREMLEDVEEPTAPFGLTNIQGDGSDISEARTFIDSDLAKRVRLRARLLGVSAASIWHVACALVLGRASGQRNPVFGTVLLGRMQGNSISDQVLGLFMNTLPIRIRLEDTAARDSVLQTHQLLAELLSHEHAPLALAQRCSGVPAPMPLFTALFNYRHSVMPSGKVEKQSLAFAGITTLAGGERTNYPLTLSVDDLGEEFVLTAQTSAPLDPHYLCSMAGRALEQLVEALELKPTYPVARLDVLPASERHKLLVEWNRTEAEYPQDRCIHELFEEQAERNPEAVAVVYEDRSLSYGELNRQANRLARYLRGQGVKPDSRVAICVERSLEMVVGLLAILKAGGAYVPLDPEYPPERLAYMLTDCEPIVVLTHEPARAQLHAVLDQTGISLPIVDLEEHGAAWVKQAETDLPPVDIGLTSRHLAYVIYTSGSTGKPKGVMVEHANIARLFFATRAWFCFDSADVWTLFHSFAFDFSVWELWGAIANGGRLVIVPKLMARSPQEFYKLLCREGVTILNQTPSAFKQLIAAQQQDEGAHRLRQVIFGGEMLEGFILKPWCRRKENLRTTLINMYGITETTVHATYHRVEPVESVSTRTFAGSPIGRRLPDLRFYILDGFGNPVPLGVVGEIYIGGVGVARGYLNRPELTAERFIDSPFVGGDRLYKTGDLGRYLADGNIEFLGRNDFQVKIRGFRIELGEIEARLISHPLVREATVIAREDEAGDKRLVAYYTVKSEPGEVGAEALRAHLSGVLPEYMVPAAYVRLEVFPLTPNGKLDRKALPAPEGDAYSRREYAAPVGEVETELAKIWSEVLGIERISRHDNFFELGGHSLLAVRVLERMRRAYKQQLSLQLLSEPYSLAELTQRFLEMRLNAPALISHSSDTRTPIVLIRAGITSPLFLFHPIGGGLSAYTELVNRLSKDVTIYGLHSYAPMPKESVSILGIALIYLGHIRNVQPAGPYSLLGYSFGGMVATEVARLLIQEHERVNILALIDTVPISSNYMESAMWSRFVGLFIRDASLRSRVTGESSNGSARFAKLCSMINLVEKLRYTPDQVEVIYQSYCRHMLAATAHAYRPYSNPVVTYRSSRWTQETQPDWLLCDAIWERNEVIMLEADHGSIVTGDAIRAIAVDLEQRIISSALWSQGSPLLQDGGSVSGPGAEIWDGR